MIDGFSTIDSVEPLCRERGPSTAYQTPLRSEAPLNRSRTERAGFRQGRPHWRTRRTTSDRRIAEELKLLSFAAVVDEDGLVADVVGAEVGHVFTLDSVASFTSTLFVFGSIV